MTGGQRKCFHQSWEDQSQQELHQHVWHHHGSAAPPASTPPQPGRHGTSVLQRVASKVDGVQS